MGVQDLSRISLRIKVKGKPEEPRKVNTLKTEIRGRDGKSDTDVQEFFVSLDDVTVPPVMGLTLAEAQAALQGAILTPGTTREKYRLLVRTGVVIGQDPAAGTQVGAGTAVDLMVVKAPPADQAIPSSWAGEWQISLGFVNPTNGGIGAVQETTDVICPGDPVGSALVVAAFPGGQVGCSGLLTDQRMEASCNAQIAANLCHLRMTLKFAMDRSGGTLSGRGEWTATGDCVASLPPYGETFVILGVRRNTDQSLCQAPTSSFIQKFMRHPLGLKELLPP